jgi:hypothetical protein
MDQIAIRFMGWSAVAAAFVLAPAAATAQVPEESSSTPAVCTRRGRLHRMFHHVAHTTEDKFVGYPQNFLEPPLGHYVSEQLAVQVAKADPHRFTLYRSDFLPGTSQFSPIGASRFNIMQARMPGWLGPISVEWTPEQPELAQARRRVILDTLAKSGKPVVDGRVIIAPSPYPGAMGVEAANNFTNTMGRSQMAAPTFPLPPTESSALGVR